MKDIILKPLEKSHLEMVREWRNSQEVASYMYSDKQIEKEEQLIWFEKLKDDKSSCYWIIYFDERPLGVANLTGIDPILQSCYWAFYLGDTSVRGGGIGAKVEYQVLKYVFDGLKLNKLRCEVFAFNEKVIKMHEKFGFRREAYYREHCKKANEFMDVVGLALLKSEWDQLKDPMKIKIYGE
jgi:UDP-4-amino-4,6-dideoxy-N-acetyl-beta-L-altrosamine N-acetyltransferase